MKVKVKRNKKSNEIKFPCLMVLFEGESRELILLATSKSDDGTYEGTIIKGNSVTSIGVQSEDWASAFKPFNGSITLSNN